jgi:hypothetical protein
MTAWLLLAAQPPNLWFSGYNWTVKDSAGQEVGPGGNVFAREAATVDRLGRLTLRVMKKGGRWVCGEVVGPTLGYGTYRWVVESGLDRQDPSSVLGLFTWSDDPKENHQEIDFESSRWGDAKAPNFQFVVQPHDLDGNMRRFTATGLTQPERVEFTWRPGQVDFVSFTYREGRWRQRKSWRRSGAGVPAFSDAAPRMNLWMFRAAAPARDQWVVLRSFSFTPLPR